MENASPKQRWFIAHLLLENGYKDRLDLPPTFNDTSCLAVGKLHFIGKKEASELIEQIMRKDWTEADKILVRLKLIKK